MPQSEHASVLSGGGEMGALMRTIDWAKTAVGPVSSWPQSLRTALSILLDTGFPMYIAWGREFTQFYNDGYRPILGSTKHPGAMGISTRETFAEIWHIIGPMFEGVMQGRATTVVDFLLPLDRNGFTEECYFIYSYSPIREESGQVGGVLVTVTETTQRVIGERRLKTTQALAAETREARTVAEACQIAGRVIERNPADIPFARIYLVDAGGDTATLAGSCGPAASTTDLPHTLSLTARPIAEAIDSGRPALLEDDGQVGRRLVLPIRRQGLEQPVGLLVAGTSPRLMLDDGYRDFLALVASQIGTGIAGAQALEEARARAEALAALDRAKTAFFSNVSHEFRTPLTLMLGPTEEALASPERALRGEALETVHRNELRLLKLVNTLLEFSRLEAGRVRARFEPTDLATLTADLASAFRSAVERAGLDLVVNCPPIEAPVFVDREMWEKIVLNLLSNAFKFTFRGRIAVDLVCDGHAVELRVSDTGTGIEAAALDRIFERFHRVERAAGRTHEGSGIGLALVKELVGIHGGTIHASSVAREGSVFTVRVPLGTAHLPAEHIVAVGRPVAGEAPVAAAPYVEEALRWLPEREESQAVPRPAATLARILVADDNADMREYIARLLSERFVVETVSDGAAALTAIARIRPDVIVSDVMMPQVDGFQLIAAIRQDPAVRTVPVILLSARAGEEASVEGLQAGADDYLVKPFSGRELVARIDALLVRAKMRTLEEAHAVRLASVFEHAPVGVAILRGREHVFEFANAQYLDLVAGRRVVGLPVRAALPELEGQGIYELLDTVLETGEPLVGRSRRVIIQRHRGEPEETFFDFVYQPLEEGGAITGIAVVAFDVTDLTRARRDAEAASRAKDEFLAMLGHELRNPLAPILTALQLMRLRGIEGAERERTIIERQVKHVVSLVDDLLDVSRITRGKVQLKRERRDLTEIVAKAVEMTSPAIENRRHRLIVNVPRGIVVDGDVARLAQVVANLLTNAAKYSDAGGEIRIEASTEGAAGVLSVSDAGRGISAAMLPRIFDLFTQERQEIDRSEGGLGIGLSLVKSLVDAHGGTVEAFSAGKGKGATFTVRLPLAASQAPIEVEPASVQRAPSAGPGLRVLIVEDNPDAAELLGEALRAVGHSTRVAYDGPRALQAAAEFLPEVALLDIGLPVMDGFELARKLRALPGLAGVQLLAVTGYGQETDRQRTGEAGFDEHMVKPVDLEWLESWLADFAQRGGQTGVRPGSDQGQTGARPGSDQGQTLV